MWAEELTVYDGTGTNNYLPLYGYYADSKGTISEFIIPSSQLTSLNGQEIEKITFYLSSPAAASWGDASFNVYLEEVEGSNYDDSSASQLTDRKTTVYQGALDGTGTTMEIPFTTNYTYNGGNLLVAIEVGTKGTYKAATFYGTTTTNNTGRYKYSSTSGRAKFIPKTTFSTPTEGPALAVKDGTTRVTSPYAYNFGLATAGTSKIFTLSNPGTADLGVSVSETGSFGATLSETTIAAGGNVTLTVTMPSTSGSSAVTITPAAGSGIDPFIINVSGTVKDPNKMFEDFSGNALPDGWVAENVSQYSSWNFSNGYACHNSTGSSSAGTLTSPKLTFTAGETIIFKTSKYGSSSWNNPGITVKTSNDGTTWSEALATFTDDVYGEWKTRSVVISSADVKYIRFTGWYVCIDDVYGGELPMIANMKVSEPETLGFGMISAESHKTFTIANTGRATLEGISVISNNTNFTITGAPTSLAAGESAEVTITMDVSSVGAANADITVSATDQTAVTFNVSGYVMDNNAIIIDFASNKFPEGWTNTGWSVSNQTATGVYTSSTTNKNSEVVSPSITVASGETMAIEAKGNGSNAELYVYVSTDQGTTWTKKGDFNTLMRANTSGYTVAVLDNVEAGTYLMKIEGYSVTINIINGFHYDQNAPMLAISPAEDATFGKVTATPSAKTYTVANNGTGKMTVNIASSSTDFTVSPTILEDIENGTPATFTVTFNYDATNLGNKNATITVTPTYNAAEAVSFQATATAKDPNVWDEDFEEGSIPTIWMNEGVWMVSTPTASGNNGTKMATITSYNNPKKLITPRLEAKANDELTFYIGMQYNDEPLTIEYSNDNMTTWQVIEDGVANYTASATVTFKAPADGFYNIRFTGTYAMLDNFNGFKLAMKDHDAQITYNSIPANGTQYAEYTATVKVKEMVGKEEKVAAELWIGETKVAEVAETTLAANSEETITLTFTPDAAMSGNAYIKVYNDDISLESEKVAVTIAEALVIDEGVVSALTDGNAASVAVNFTAKAGWNTICMPFALSNDDMKAIFGDGWKAYEFKSYANDELHFDVARTFYAGYPYIVYSETPANTQLKKQNVTIEADVHADEYGGAKFQGTYAPIAAPNMEGKYGVVPATGKIAKGGTSASIKGFRAYFELPSSANGARLSFTDVTTGITTVMDASELGDDAFNLKGQRVDTPKKSGLYIIGGKKVIVK